MRNNWKFLTTAILLGAGIMISEAEITVDLVNIGNAGNLPDQNYGFGALGAVDHNFAMGKYEVTIAQYTSFLNAVAVTDTYGLYNTQMGTNLNVAGISRSGSSGNYTYSVMNNAGSSANRPITYVSWFDAARFSNWLANGQPTGAQVNYTTEDGAYALNGVISGGLTITKNTTNPNTGLVPTYWLPSKDEWYKTAFYEPGASQDSYWLYPTRSDSVPGNTIGSEANQANFDNGVYTVSGSSIYSITENYLTESGAFSGSGSFYGTYDQAGNVWEWVDGVNNGERVLLGGCWFNNSNPLAASDLSNTGPTAEQSYYGFRVASIPEPSTAWLMILAGGALFWLKRAAIRQ